MNDSKIFILRSVNVIKRLSVRITNMSYSPSFAVMQSILAECKWHGSASPMKPPKRLKPLVITEKELIICRTFIFQPIQTIQAPMDQPDWLFIRINHSGVKIFSMTRELHSGMSEENALAGVLLLRFLYLVAIK